MDFKAEIDDLKRRVGDLEGAVNVMSGRFGAIQPELHAVKRQSSEGFDRLSITLDRVVARLDTMNTQVWSLRDDLPLLIGQVIASHKLPHGETGAD